MRRLFGAGWLLVVCLVMPGLDARGQNKKKGNVKAAVETTDSGKLTAGDFIGILRSVPGSDRLFVLEMQEQKLIPVAKPKNGQVGLGVEDGVSSALTLVLVALSNPAGGGSNQKATPKTGTKKTTPNNTQPPKVVKPVAKPAPVKVVRVPARRHPHPVRGIRKPVPPGYREEVVKKNIEFQTADGVKVRTMLLPEAFDEKGNLKKYTKEELAQLKGEDKNAAGYEFSLDKLEVGQKVRVTLAAAPRKAEDKENKDKDAGDATEKKMQVKSIVVLEAAENAQPAGKGKAKKK